jgi:hypothetical protein
MKGLAFSFTEKCQFTVKIDRNSVFLTRKAHILDRLHIKASYISFYGFFFQILTQNLKGLAVSFIEKHQFAIKSDRSSVFLGYKVHILYQLCIMVRI